MNNNRKTLSFLKPMKSCDFARRKNDAQDKMLDTKLKVMEKEERGVRQKLYEIRREKYSRTFYRGPERPKFVDVNVCETEEDDSNKLNLITASGVERTKNSLRRKSIAVEELNPGQVVRVCVSSKLEDKVTGDETGSPSTCLPPQLPPIVKAPPKKRRHSVAIVTDIEHHNMADLFTSVTSYMQSISEESEGVNICKDDLYFGRRTEEKYSETTFDEGSGRNADDQVTRCSEKLHDLKLQTTVEEAEEKSKLNDCGSNANNKNRSFRQKTLVEDNSSAKVSKADVRKTETGCNSPVSTRSVSSSPKRKVKSTRQANNDFSYNLRSQSSRSYSDSSLQERATFRKCITPVPVLSRNHSRMRPVDTSTAVYEGAAMGHKQRFRSLSAGSEHQPSVLTEKEVQMAEQVIIRQLEIRERAERMKKLSLQHFGDSKTTLKIPRKQNCSTSPYARRRLEDAASYDTTNNIEGSPRPGIVRRHIHNPQLLKKIVKNHCRNDKGKTIMEKVLCELSGDMPDCRYLRCGDKASENKEKL